MLLRGPRTNGGAARAAFKGAAAGESGEEARGGGGGAGRGGAGAVPVPVPSAWGCGAGWGGGRYGGCGGCWQARGLFSASRQSPCGSAARAAQLAR